MQRRVLILCGVLAWTISASPAQNDLLQSALDPNPGLEAYTAAAHLDVTLHAGLPVHKTFTGTMYYTRPTQRLVLDNASGALSKYKDMRMTLPSKDEIFRDYTLSSTTDDGSVTQFVFTPKAQDSRVTTVTLSVTDATRRTHDVRWSYKNNSSLVIGPTYQSVQGYSLPAHEDIAARFPGYSIDATLGLKNFTFTK